MSDTIINIPQVRFKGFNDAWEQRKLGDVLVDMYNGQTPYRLNEDNWNGDINWLSSGELNRGIVSETIEKITAQGQNEANLKLIPKGTFVIAITGLEASGTRGNCAILGIDTTMNQSCMALFPKKEILDSKFLFQWYRKVGEEYGISYTQGTKQQSYNAEIIKLLPISLPSIKEQSEITECLFNLDNLITLHQRKLELLKETKKGMLQKMFPKDGADVPEIRFSGFTDAWEQRKVGEFLTESKIKGSDGSIAKKLTVKLWRKGIVPKEEIYEGSSATQYYVRKSGQFMYGKLDFLNQAFGIVPPELDGYESTLDSPAFDFRDGIDSRFFLEYVSLKQFYKYQGNIANGSRKAKRIHAETFFEMPISVPSYAEQQIIGSFLEQLDATITLYQRELDLIKDLKKSLLQQMFI